MVVVVVVVIDSDDDTDADGGGGASLDQPSNINCTIVHEPSAAKG